MTRVLYCSGKVYYDLLKKQTESSVANIAIVRIEQIYPFPEQQLLAIKAKYANAKEHIWVQEESVNMGAWFDSANVPPYGLPFGDRKATKCLACDWFYESAFATTRRPCSIKRLRFSTIFYTSLKNQYDYNKKAPDFAIRSFLFMYQVWIQ